MTDLLRSSRPFSWINTALPFLAMAWAVHRGPTLAIVLGVLYFLAPYNLLLYGVNDLYDYESDRLNPRKGGAIEGAVIDPSRARNLWLAIVASNLPFLLALALFGGVAVTIVLAVTVLVALAYSMTPARTKVIPGLDSATSALHFVLPAVCGGVVAGARLASLPWTMLGAFVLWGMASQALGAIQDVEYDRQAGIGSIAVALGARNTALFALGGYAASVLLVGSVGGPALIAAAALLPYVLLAASCLSGNLEDQARRAWKSFLGLNLLAGFVITQVLLHLWIPGDITVLQLLAWGTAAGVLALLFHTVVNEWAMRRRAPRPPAWPSITVVIPARNEAATIGRCLRGLRSQRYDGAWTVVVVDDDSTDGTCSIVRQELGPEDALLEPGPPPPSWTGKCWAAYHGARVARGQVLVFLDADTELEPFALQALAAEIVEHGGLASLLTRYRMEGLAEKLFMPAFVHMQLCFLPIAWLNSARGPRSSLAYAYGPCMAVSRPDYEASGGHAAIRASDREDVDLARSMGRAGYCTRFLHGADLASTRHYRNLHEVVSCWRRTFYAYGGNSLAVALFGMLGIAAVFLLPIVLLIAALARGDMAAVVGSVVGVAGLLALRILLVVRERQPAITILAHPITWLGTLTFQAMGVVDGLRGLPPRWRGRALPTELAR